MNRYEDLSPGDRVMLEIKAFGDLVSTYRGTVKERLKRGMIIHWDQDSAPTRVLEAEHYWKRGLLKPLENRLP